jgi:hypothetical protein
MSSRKKPAKPRPRPAYLICPGQDFERRVFEARLQEVVLEPEPESTRALRDFEAACVRAYWLALLRD